ncbi:MAG: hypothetical protein IJ209_03455 [Bacteroidaceae bacterium]|nr:hypothetical protein [Bacteroidaceae bacterium]
MKHLRHLLPAAALLSASLHTAAQTDVTSAYLTNPSFEADAAQCTDALKKSEAADGLRGWDVSAITGWTTTRPDKQLLITADCFTDNNFGKTTIAEGQYALFQRMGWTNGTSTVSQTSTQALTAGKYMLTAKVKAFYANSATSSAIIQVKTNGKSIASAAIAFAQGSAGCMASSDWTTASLRFTLAEAATIDVEVSVTWVSGGSQIALDDFRLTELPADTPDEPTPEATRYTEGIITHDFVPEAEMMQDLLQMLANSMQYAKSIWFNCQAPNSVGEVCGYFKGNSAGQSNEDGVRTNADFAMIAAFLCKYAQGKVTLPEGMTWDEVKQMAMKSLVFGYSTHKANKLKVTADNKYWGSTATNDAVWESSLWTMSLCYASHFLKDELTDAQRSYIYNMVKAECNYELGRSIPTGYAGDTKAEENGWEADVLACALGLYPDDAQAARWFDRLRDFAINSYSQVDDANNTSVIDPDYDQKTVADYYRGQNLYDDYTLQNHNLFHTSYQNVVMQELGEAHLAMLLFQGDNTKWKTNALMHNQQQVLDLVLKRLALSDGELAMPNGNDWSLFLFDQITSYSTAACFLRDADALMLENMAYKYIKARQQTTQDGSWLLNSDIGPRRMGVEAHRVMMTYLMHLAASTANLQPSTWNDFSIRQQQAYIFKSQNIIRASSDDRFVTFSWSNGLKSYTGYIADTTPDRNKIICPFRANNTGNLLGWYTVSGKGTNASPTVSGIYKLYDTAFTMNGRITTNDATLENSFVLAATRGNAVVYLSNVKALQNATLTGRRGGLLAITVDPFTSEQRTIYTDEGEVTTNGAATHTWQTHWANIDQSVGIVTLGGTGQMAFGDRALNNSIQCAKFYPLYSQKNEAITAGNTVDRTAVIYYSRVDAATTERLQAQAMSLNEQLPEGWNGLIACDPDGERNIIVANLAGGANNKAKLKGLAIEGLGAPVLQTETIIEGSTGSATIALDENHSLMHPLTVFIKNATGVAAKMFNPVDDKQLYVRSLIHNEQNITVSIMNGSSVVSKDFLIPESGTLIIRLDDGELQAYAKEVEEELTDLTAQYIVNPNFEEDETWGTTGSITLSGTTYAPCYTQTVGAADSQFPQVLPVKGWDAASTLSPASKFALLYSMPYSFTQYCVSPSSLGNSASIMAVPAAFEESVGKRCLSILNSWTVGTNAVKQVVALPKGYYELSFKLRYSCANESRRTAENVIASTDGNTNTLLCRVTANDEEFYAPYPTSADTWETKVIGFSVEPDEGSETADVDITLGLKTTENQGATNQTRLYIDDLRLRGHVEQAPDGISASAFQSADSKFYDLGGRQFQELRKTGFVIQKGQKYSIAH